ncbi:MAG: hypothetical protein DME09_22665 [Candidatus Rokuibacteriota bacterium]|nr:MAG: hypothetical protein DME09_22665 [Candidatus Rokubacteria bacterium]
MLGTGFAGVLIAVCGVLLRSHEILGIGVTMAVIFSLGGLHRHDWDAMDRRMQMASGGRRWTKVRRRT